MATRRFSESCSRPAGVDEVNGVAPGKSPGAGLYTIGGLFNKK
jgi:hypothetical protein